MKCKDCGITLQQDMEIEDGRCGNCQADFVRATAKKAFQDTIDALNYLSEYDYEDSELAGLYNQLGQYFTRP